MARILIVEDHADLAFGLRRTLEFEGHRVQVAATGEAGLESVQAQPPDLIILDAMLPGIDGFRVLRTLRADGHRVPVLMLTARGEEADVVLGFDSGADDYVTKPFGTAELQARVRALLRRQGSAAAADDALAFGAVRIDPGARTVARGDEPVALTPKEFDLLVALYRRKGAVASRAELLSEVWGYTNPDVPTRTVDIHLAELRRKLEDDPASPRHLLTVRKAGYRLKR